MTSGGLLCFAALMNFAVGGFGDLWGFDLVVWVAFVGVLLHRGGVSWFGFPVVLCW